MKAMANKVLNHSSSHIKVIKFVILVTATQHSGSSRKSIDGIRY